MDLAAGQRATLVASLERMGVIASGEQPQFTVLPGGVSSLIVRADTSRGAICIKQALPRLKVAQEWYAPVERNGAEIAWLKLVADIAAEAVPAILGEDRIAQAFAMPFLDPGRYPTWKAQLLAGEIAPETARRVGELLGSIHAATAHRAEVARDFANDATFFAIRLEPYLIGAARAHPDCASELQALVDVTARTKHVLMHGDVSPKNILIGPEGPLFLDAECACFGEPAFDLGFCLNHLLLKCVARPARRSDYLACFDALAGAYLDRVDWEPRGSVDARTARLLAGLLLARIDGKSPVEYITAERDQRRVRDFAKRFLRAPADQLASLRVAFGESA